MGRDSPIQVYVEESNKEWLKDQADARDESCSEYCRKIITEHIEQQPDDQQHRQYSADQQIELVLNQIRDETTARLSNFQSSTGTLLERLQRLRTIYAIAVWRLIKQDYTVEQQEAALKYAVDHAGLDPTEEPELQPVWSPSETQSLASGPESPTNDHSEPSQEDNK